MQILDTHLHLVYRPQFQQPWMAGFPAIDQAWTAQSYFAEAEPLGIVGALHMEVDVVEAQMLEEARFMGTAHPKVIGAIAAGRPEHANFSAHLDALAKMPHVRGVRRVLHTMPDELSTSALFVDNIRLLAAQGLSFDLCVRANQLHLAHRLAAAAPDVQFILDHCGNPDIAGEGYAGWKTGLAQLAGLPNVAAKISGIAVNAAPGWGADTLKPYVEQVIENFGWDRVVWGSDHPVLRLNGSLGRWVEASLDLTASASEAERSKLFYHNAKRIYRLGGQHEAGRISHRDKA
ncbi:amidohydrolase family protein [Devosia faecipullorum]|uniref:amidohydrolase family protein n=1 Tax=Devosia faecipullorum TaxID=2755039 RepID=UPI00187B1648|nr:amidohydrolase family protein [Devosia faecipullorum]MBE7732723.1 amidohydrolase family protein [Devosia faecipullorum]